MKTRFLAFCMFVFMASTLCAQADCEITFFKQLITPGKSSSGYKIVPMPGGNFFLAASADEESVVALADKDLNIIWAKAVDLAPGPDAITDLRFDSDGKMIGTGTAGSAPVECFAFKMNPADGQLIWRSNQNSPINSYFSRILEKTPNGNYLIFGQTDAAAGGSGCDALIMEVDRNSGAWIWDKHYDLGSCEVFQDVFIENNLIYTCGRYNLDNSGQAGFRAAMTVLDLDGNIQWSKHYIQNTGSARQYATGLLRDTAGVVVTGYSVASGTVLANSVPTLMKVDDTGKAKWYWRYDISGATDQIASKIISLPDGYLITGTFMRANLVGRDIFLIKTDKNGYYVWGKSFGINGDDRLSDVVLSAGHIFLIGRRQSGQVFNTVIGKLNLNGEVEVSCDYAKPMALVVEPVPNPSSFEHNLKTIEVDLNYETSALSVAQSQTIFSEAVCVEECLCTGKPDFSVSGVEEIRCANGYTQVQVRVCNFSDAPLPNGTRMSLYNADPTLTNAVRINTDQLYTSVNPGTCVSSTFQFIPPPDNTVIYLVLNDGGALNTPFVLDSLVNSGVPECDYTNNLFNFVYIAPVAPPLLNLGPDRTDCVPVRLKANSGFERFVWQDGSTDSTFTATSTGLYWLEATDICGHSRRDSVTITILPSPQRSTLLEFCPGSSVTIGSNTYTQPGTVVDTIAATTGCDTLVTYTLQFIALPQPSVIALQCPADITVVAATGAPSAAVSYASAAASTDCPCGVSNTQLQQGLTSGSNFPVGVTQVCYRTTDDCGTSRSCCFSVTVNAPPVAEEACDVKNTTCVKFEILGIFQNPQKQRTYRMRITNTCANKLIYTTFQLPNGITADLPLAGTTYTAPSGRPYEVRNPNYTPARSIRFKSVGDGIANGQSDIFEYTLPPQSEPLFIYASARLEPQVFYETHLNTFDCAVQQTSSKPASGTGDRESGLSPSLEGFTIFPNPAVGPVFVQLPPDWSDQRVHLRVTDAYGRVINDPVIMDADNLIPLDLPVGWPAGLYHVEVRNDRGERLSGRFVKQ